MTGEMWWESLHTAPGTIVWRLVERVPAAQHSFVSIYPLSTCYFVIEHPDGVRVIQPEGDLIRFDTLKEAQDYCEVRYRIEKGANHATT